jgi:peptidoglycan hydrolase-like protein with peptidoglycan-binding domain
LAFGAMGEATKQLQEDLNSLGFDCGEADGIFGSKTKEQVIAF